MESSLEKDRDQLIVKFGKTATLIGGRVELVKSPSDSERKLARALTEFNGTCVVLGTISESVSNGESIVSHLALRSGGGDAWELQVGAGGRPGSATAKNCLILAKTFAQAGALVLRYPTLAPHLSPIDDTVLKWAVLLVTRVAGNPHLRKGDDGLLRISNPCAASIAMLNTFKEKERVKSQQTGATTTKSVKGRRKVGAPITTKEEGQFALDRLSEGASWAMVVFEWNRDHPGAEKTPSSMRGARDRELKRQREESDAKRRRSGKKRGPKRI